MRRTSRTIEQAVDRAMAQPGIEIRVRQGVWSASFASNVLRIFHYGTLVLSADTGASPIHAELGTDARGSVSDQSGVNRVLKHVGLSVRAQRSGGFRLEQPAAAEQVDEWPEDDAMVACAEVATRIDSELEELRRMCPGLVDHDPVAARRAAAQTVFEEARRESRLPSLYADEGHDR